MGADIRACAKPRKGGSLAPARQMSHSAPMTAIRPAILDLERNGIGDVAFLGLGRTDIIPLWFGEGDVVTPDFIRDAAKRALDEGKTFYTFTRGMTELREAIADWASRQAGREIELERVTVPGAAMMGVQIALQCVCEPGDNVIIVSPMWPNIFQAVRGLGAEPRFVRLNGGANGEPWTLDLERLFAAADARTKAIFFASPSNPTGWIMSEREQRAILDFARKRGIAIISDEVYTPIVYDTPAPSFAAIAEPDDDVFVVNSFSKAWAMTGWRVGWLIHPRKLGVQMAEMAAYNNTGAAVFAQYGALEAITKGDEFVKWHVERCRNGLGDRREVLRRAKPHELVEAGRRVLRLPRRRRHDRQHGVRQAPARRSESRRRARHRVRPEGRQGQRPLHPHLLCASAGAVERGAGADREGDLSCRPPRSRTCCERAVSNLLHFAHAVHDLDRAFECRRHGVAAGSSSSTSRSPCSTGKTSVTRPLPLCFLRRSAMLGSGLGSSMKMRRPAPVWAAASFKPCTLMI